MLDLVKKASDIDFEPEFAPRRPGDPARIVASPALAAKELGWTAKLGYPEMVQSAWETWRQVAAARLSRPELQDHRAGHGERVRAP